MRQAGFSLGNEIWVDRAAEFLAIHLKANPVVTDRAIWHMLAVELDTPGADGSHRLSGWRVGRGISLKLAVELETGPLKRRLIHTVIAGRIKIGILAPAALKLVF